MIRKKLLVLTISAVFMAACSDSSNQQEITKSQQQTPAKTEKVELLAGAEERLDIYYPVALSADLSAYSDNQKQMLSLLIDASKIMDELFWMQAFGQPKQEFLDSLTDPKVRAFADINYGPWDRLNGDKPFLTQTEEKPLGAQFYPEDMSKEEYLASDIKQKDNLYSMVSRDQNGKLIEIPYADYFADELEAAADLLIQASELADNQTFANYLKIRADALVTDNYQPSDFAWMQMKDNPIELVIGPIETYEDQLFGYRAAFEAYVLLKDLSWSERLAKYAAYLPELQKGLPVADEYKAEMPGSNADLNAYDVIYYAGHSNAGSKTIAINLPNDEEVQLKNGTRRLQLKNAMRAKFDHILMPISELLITPEQRKHITFNAFFANTMFHEVAHGLGIKNTLDGEGTVRGALKEHASALEEGKADILGLYMVEQLLKKGAITEGQLEDYYVTFMAGIFRSVRFGASSAHGKANMIRFNFFQEKGAFSRDENGLYQVNMEKMGDAIAALSEVILTLQGDGDYQGVGQLVAEKGIIKEVLAQDLQKLTDANIPVDVIFKQGKEVLKL
ncbi:Zn-dependent hydrolase [Aliiglaciecola sp. 2_MG-2023]|uniref:dipeptidyl-peptidase 3 family protein n=1 Tax=Alteromonadaceae TaxID=72275 RepID=UPI0026E33DA9|nr:MULTISPECIES: Zn-dependent hydrolase [unclassified Aliiglaciecola]MDO6712037.1 Zn-dependent hydrolase [Aliiglaciecola sp. 2_MG-2023]MDO6753599.1 Zn-dependent hydrolase [Aliiglaciecola sp. 1_MG-2023]